MERYTARNDRLVPLRSLFEYFAAGVGYLAYKFKEIWGNWRLFKCGLVTSLPYLGKRIVGIDEIPRSLIGHILHYCLECCSLVTRIILSSLRYDYISLSTAPNGDECNILFTVISEYL